MSEESNKGEKCKKYRDSDFNEHVILLKNSYYVFLLLRRKDSSKFGEKK